MTRVQYQALLGARREMVNWIVFYLFIYFFFFFFINHVAPHTGI